MVEWQVHNADCLDVLPNLDLVDAVITDPPYGLKFMGKNWDHGVPGVAFWEAILGAMKPGAHLVAFGGTRTHHRLMVAIEDAGFEIRDVIMWVYGSGFPKSLDVSKAIDKAAGAERKVVGSKLGQPGYSLKENDTDAHNRKTYGQYTDAVKEVEITEATTNKAKEWEGWGTALKPAYEPIILARKPLIGTVAQNVLEHGTGALNIDESRVITEDNLNGGSYAKVSNRHDLPGIERSAASAGRFAKTVEEDFKQPEGRWPANFIHDGSDEVVELFPQTGKANMRYPTGKGILDPSTGWNQNSMTDKTTRGFTDQGGSASRFFYCAKASKGERDAGLTEEHTAGEMTDRKDGSAGLNSPRAGTGRTSGGKNNHPTVKPLALMRYLCKLVTPPGGVILDPFAGSGSTLVAATELGFDSVGIELEKEYAKIMVKRLESCKEDGEDNQVEKP